MTPSNKSFPFYHKLAAVLVSLVAVGYLVVQGKELLSPLIFSCLFSILLLPLAAIMENKFHFRRGLASILSVLLLLLLVAGIVYMVGVQMSDLTDDWPQFKMQLNNSLSGIQHWIALKFHINSTKQLTYIKSAASNVLASGTAVVGVTIVSLSSMFLFFVFTFIYTLFFLTYRRIIMHFLISVFLEENSLVVHDIVEQVQQILRKYITGLFIEMCIVSVVVCLALFALGIKYSLLLGLITGLFNIIPYIGIFTATLISVLITFATAAAAGKVFLVLITLVVTHLVDSNILLPAIVGSKVKINPLITVLGVVLGEMIWGISGMFLSIPVIAVLKIIFDRIESLKPWGILLGEQDKTIQAKKTRVEIKDVATDTEIS
ncbi:MAG TPA: AI-2E family transporter [Puia sp.]|jgi:predicted PurR-regulated permease PerM